MQLGHVPGRTGVEVHAVEADDEGQRDEDGGDDGECVEDADANADAPSP